MRRCVDTRRAVSYAEGWAVLQLTGSLDLSPNRLLRFCFLGPFSGIHLYVRSVLHSAVTYTRSNLSRKAPPTQVFWKTWTESDTVLIDGCFLHLDLHVCAQFVVLSNCLCSTRQLQLSVLVPQKTRRAELPETLAACGLGLANEAFPALSCTRCLSHGMAWSLRSKECRLAARGLALVSATQDQDLV